MRNVIPLFACILFSIQLWSQTFKKDNINYNINAETNTVEVIENIPVYTGNLVIPDSVIYLNKTYFVTSIGLNAFKDCSELFSIKLSNNILSIGNDAFSGCSNLNQIEIPGSTISIGERSFRDCSNLPSLIIPDNVTSIGHSAFSDCHGLVFISIGRGVINFGERAFCCCNNLDSVVIRDGAINIGWSAFENCVNLTSITIPNSVKEIGPRAFIYCSKLTSISIPKSVTNIGQYAFSYCTNLRSMTLPSSISRIEMSTFENCSNLTSVTIGENISYIGHDAFSSCSSLDSIYIPHSVTYIGRDAFCRCTNLTSVTIPCMVANISSNAFSHCINLTSVVFEKGVTNLTGSVFYNCPNLKNIYTKSSMPPSCQNNTFTTTTMNTCKLHIPKGSLDQYKKTSGWKLFIDIVEDLDSDKDTLVITPKANSAIIEYPLTDSAHNYRFFLYADDTRSAQIAVYEFDEYGDNLKTKNGFSYTIEDLMYDTKYYYIFVAYNNKEEPINAISGDFTIRTSNIETLKQRIFAFKVYPNPVINGKLVVMNKDKLIMSNGAAIQFYDLNGKQMDSFAMTREMIELDISHLPNGAYFVKLGNAIQKIIKK